MKVGLLTAMPQEMVAYYPAAANSDKYTVNVEGVLCRTSGIGKVNATIAAVDLIRAGAEIIYIGGTCASTSGNTVPFSSFALTAATQHDYGMVSDKLYHLRPGSVPGDDRLEVWYQGDPRGGECIRP